MSDVDAFDAARDEILLDQDQHGEEDDMEDFGAYEREVLAMDPRKKKDESEEEESDEEVEEEVGGDDDEDDDDRYRTMILPASMKDTTRRQALRDEAHEEQEIDSEEDEELGWGAGKRSYYSSNTAEDLESDSEIDEDRAHELETNEAVRLQRQSRAGMDDAEFGLDAIGAEEAQVQADEQSEAARLRRRRDLDEDDVSTPDVSRTPEEMKAQLQNKCPIVLALVDEYRDSLRHLEETRAYVDRVSGEGERQVAEIAHLYLQTLSSYTMMLAFFFELSASPGMLDAPDKLLQHPVMARMAQFKRAMVDMQGLGLFDALSVSDSEEERLVGPPSAEDRDYEEQGDLEPNEVDELLADARFHADVPSAPAPKKKKEKKAKKAKAPVPEPEAPREQGLLPDVADVDDSVPTVRASRSKPSSALEDEDAYGEPVQMRASERQDKAQRRRDVQFHATNVDVSGPAKAPRLEGDVDIPYRDKRHIRDAVAAAKSNRLAKSKALEDASLSGADWGESDWTARDDVMSDGAAGDDGDSDDAEDDAAYYELVSSRKRARKEQQKAAYDQQRLAERVYDDESLAPGEHRSINYQMEKNKGLTPHRPKSVRNPRVKRRMRYERAKKRLSSTRAVYKGGQSALQGGYAGEQSGISTHLVKSRKLGS